MATDGMKTRMGGTAMTRQHDDGDGRHNNGDGWHNNAARHDDNDGMMMGNRNLASAVPTIQGNNQLMLIVGGGGAKRGG